MKKIFALAAIIVASCFMTATAKKSTEPIVGEYVGQYNEKMTPENSCVIFLLIPGTSHAEFKQINPKRDVDTQSFEYEALDMYQITVFKPCKPGSKYMLTEFSGTMGGGFKRTYWDMEFEAIQQYMVIDVPNEPGIYCYESIPGVDIASYAHDNKVYPTPLPNNSKYNKTFYKTCKDKFQKKYGSTPWWNAYKEKMNTIENVKPAKK